MIPNGIPSLLDASFATNCPTRVFLIVSQRTSKFSPLTFSIARFTTPGPLTPTLMIASASVTPWKAPAINGLSSGALQNTTNFAHPRHWLSFVSSAVSLMISPINFTASMLIPVFVEPTLTEEHTKSVSANAFGIERINNSSAFVIPLLTNAEYPPKKLTPTFFAAASNTFASSTKSSGVLHTFPPTKEIGVIEIRLLTIGIPNSFSISFPVFTRSFATVVILL